jgi:hypothetical protein
MKCRSSSKARKFCFIAKLISLLSLIFYQVVLLVIFGHVKVISKLI